MTFDMTFYMTFDTTFDMTFNMKFDMTFDMTFHFQHFQYFQNFGHVQNAQLCTNVVLVIIKLKMKRITRSALICITCMEDNYKDNESDLDSCSETDTDELNVELTHYSYSRPPPYFVG